MLSLDRIAIGSVGIGIVVLGIKLLAWWLTGSVALFSDALESTVNVATAIAALAAVRLSAKPADANHPYGHYKAEYLSAVIEGVLIVIAALLIFREAYLAFIAPRPLEQPIGLLVSAVATAINAAWCFLLIRQGQLHRSPAIVADGKHLLTDVISSTGVVIGLALSVVTGWVVLDPILATLVALVILSAGWSLMRESVGGLMDEAVQPDILDKIRGVIGASAAGALEAHDLRTRQAGRVTFIDFHLVVPGSMAVSEAHAICDEIERALKAQVSNSLVTIHVEPEEKAKHHGVVVL
jgi:cation diffusion facilitator family transporter